MNKNKTPIVGIDVSKDTFNAYFNGFDGKYANSKKGFQSLLKETPQASVYAMEATGNYHYRLAVFLKTKGYEVKVFNPLSVSLWIKSLKNKAKTDKRDARLIAKYAGTEEARALLSWELPAQKIVEARVILSLLDGLARLERASGNMNHAAKLVLNETNSLLGVMSSVSGVCGEQQEMLEKKLCGLMGEVYPKQFRLLQTIPGIGAKTAACLLASARNIESFETGGRLVSFIGLAPKVEQSGTSVHAKGKIAKTGNTYLRSLLFMCAFTACQFNKPCFELYSRLIAKGKPKKVALVAVMHRLVKIAFGVVKSGEPFRGGEIAF